MKATHPRARKAHRCCECKGTISPGEVYHRANGIWDQGPDSYATCTDCETLRTEVARHGCPCWSFGGLIDELCEFDEGYAGHATFYQILAKRNPGSLHRFAGWGAALAQN